MTGPFCSKAKLSARCYLSKTKGSVKFTYLFPTYITYQDVPCVERVQNVSFKYCTHAEKCNIRNAIWNKHVLNMRFHHYRASVFWMRCCIHSSCKWQITLYWVTGQNAKEVSAYGWKSPFRRCLPVIPIPICSVLLSLLLLGSWQGMMRTRF